MDGPDVFLSQATNLSVAVDGGAYHGSWSVAMGKRFQRVLAFELCPKNYMRVVRTLIEQRIDNVWPYNIALGNADCDVYYVPDKALYSEVKRVYPAVIEETGNPSEPVRMMRLDSFCLPDLGFLKLDLQGYDYFALMGAEATIKKFRPLIHLEIDLPSQHTFNVPLKAQALLTEWGYKEISRHGDEAFWGPC